MTKWQDKLHKCCGNPRAWEVNFRWIRLNKNKKWMPWEQCSIELLGRFLVFVGRKMKMSSLNRRLELTLCFGKSWWWNNEERWYSNITSQCSTNIFPIQILYMTVSWTEENSGKENIERIGEKCSEQYNASALSTSYRSL